MDTNIKDMFNKSVRDYVLAIIVSIVFFIIVALVVMIRGDNWIMIAWSFPLLAILLFLPKDGGKSIEHQSGICMKFIIAYAIFTLATLAAYYVAARLHNRTLAIAMALVVWLILSIVSMIYIGPRLDKK